MGLNTSEYGFYSVNISGMFEELEKLNEHRKDSEYGRGTHVENNLDII